MQAQILMSLAVETNSRNPRASMRGFSVLNLVKTPQMNAEVEADDEVTCFLELAQGSCATFKLKLHAKHLGASFA